MKRCILTDESKCPDGVTPLCENCERKLDVPLTFKEWCGLAFTVVVFIFIMSLLTGCRPIVIVTPSCDCKFKAGGSVTLQKPITKEFLDSINSYSNLRPLPNSEGFRLSDSTTIKKGIPGTGIQLGPDALDYFDWLSKRAYHFPEQLPTKKKH